MSHGIVGYLLRLLNARCSSGGRRGKPINIRNYFGMINVLLIYNPVSGYTGGVGIANPPGSIGTIDNQDYIVYFF
jgi:hypothetical protein